MNLSNKNSFEKIKKLQNEELKVIENLKYFLKNINEKNKEFNSILNLYEDLAKKKAQFLDNLNKDEKKKMKLFGMVCLIKSNISKIDFNISCSSKTLENYFGTFDSDVVKFLEKEGCIILGNLNCDEFASGSTGKNSAFGKTINPISLKRVPGGSSSGSSSAVASNFCDFSLGTDTGGSIRTPASFCKNIGIKPSYGKVSRYGLICLAMSFDQIGPISNDLYLSAKVLEVISDFSENDSIMEKENNPKENYVNLIEENKNQNKKYKIGIIKNLNSMIKDEKIKKLLDDKIKKIKSLENEILEFEIKNVSLGIACYYPIVYSEFFSDTRKFDGIKYGKIIEDTIGIEGLRRILGGLEITKAEFEGEFYKKALSIRKELQSEFNKIFEKVDFILTPITPVLSPKFNENLSFEEEYSIDAFSVLANICEIPAGVLSKDLIEVDNEKIPNGFQILAKKNDERNLFLGLDLLNKI